MNAKKNGVKIWASGRISCSSSSCASVSATMRPATNAPMIAASPTYAEMSASANISMNAGTSGVSANSGQVNTSRFRPRARRAAANPSPTSPNADTVMSSADWVSSPVAAPVTSPIAIRARMSSITAAPRTTRENVRSSTPSSPRTRLVIPMLVAHRARPTNAAVSISAPIAKPEPDPGRDRQDHRDDRGQDRRPADRQQVVEAHLQPDREQQDDHAELGEDRGRLAGVDEPERIGTDDEATEQLADDGGLTQATSDLLAELRADEQDEQAEQDVGRRLGGGRGRGNTRAELTEGERVRHRGTTIADPRPAKAGGVLRCSRTSAT